MRTIAVIPARGGSKRIKRKNIRPFCGKPIIAYSVEAAIQSGVFDDIIVSTDDETIANVARSSGASVPFMRPEELSDDFVGVVPVVAHAIKAVGGADRACLIYATAPFVSPQDLRNAAQTLEDADFALSIAAYESPIFRALKMDENGRVSSIWREYEQRRSQDLEEAFHDAAHFCFGRSGAFLEGRSIFNSRTIGCLIDKRRVQDIDSPSDWLRAEAMFKALACE
ncbi:MAG: pseudaminic acid cytidylyltransferase [Helicobacteraceae bacterium]|jgi:N-acylneuraminate cytidylyltransferase|nr:pseudaminic acid cytidylyltransferase [Helicobacteraceae bacterium]